MAIVIEEEQNKVDVVSIMIWLTILVIIAVAVYYIFFKTPALVEVIVPTNFANIEPLAHLNVDPNAVVNQISGSLKSYITPLQPGNAGRPNPFLVP